MGINNFGRLFMPKNKVFYELFEDVAEKAHEMGIKLKEMVSEPDPNKRAASPATYPAYRLKSTSKTTGPLSTALPP